MFIKTDTAIAGTKKKSKRNDANETSNSVSRLPLVSQQGNRNEFDGGEPPEHPIFNSDSQGALWICILKNSSEVNYYFDALDAVAARKEDAENWNSPDIRKRARSKNKRGNLIYKNLNNWSKVYRNCIVYKIKTDTAIDGIEKKNKRNDTKEISESSNSVSRVPLVSPQGNRIECDVAGEPPKHPIFNGDSQGTLWILKELWNTSVYIKGFRWVNYYFDALDAVAWKEVGDGTCNSPDIRNRVRLINKGGNYTSNNLNNLSKVNINFIVF